MYHSIAEKRTKLGEHSQSLRASRVDIREQLFNEGATGDIASVSLPAVRITSVRGLLYDIDPTLLKFGNLLGAVPSGPAELYENSVRHWLQRHETLSKAEVRVSGVGLHVLLWFEPYLEATSDAERDQIAASIEIAQAALPSDPRAPGITATTRALGSVNGKNSREVAQLKAGEAVPREDLDALCADLTERPFRHFVTVLTGDSQISPCPICRTPGTTLESLNYVGKCYAKCGQVTLDQLLSEVFSK